MTGCHTIGMMRPQKNPKLIFLNFGEVFKWSNLGEAKCYSGNSFSGDWVVKLIGRMSQQNINFALLLLR